MSAKNFPTIQKELATDAIIFILSIVFNLLFWHEDMGLNVLIYAVLMVVAIIWQYQEEVKSSLTARLLLGGMLLAAVWVVINASSMSKVVFILSHLVLVGYLQQTQLRFLVFMLFMAMTNFLQMPVHLLESIERISKKIVGNRIKVILKNNVRLLPILAITVILPIFYGIYYAANPYFAELADSFWGQVFQFINLNWLTVDFFWRLMFWFLGVAIVGAFFWQSKIRLFDTTDWKNDLQKSEKEPSADWVQGAFWVIILLNILLFLNNITDFMRVWLGVNHQTFNAAALSNFVHEGTFLLIFAILLAIAVLLVVFQGGLNFIEKSQSLRMTAYIWLLQNVFLTLSVGIRNWYYIQGYGLAYKRVGVFIFLLAVLSGWVVLLFKIKEKETTYAFFRKGAWAIYAIGLLAAAVNWDTIITRYNIQNDKIDTHFLIYEVSDKNLFQLINHPKITPTELNCKIYDYQQRQKRLSWLSWNYADQSNKYFLEMKNILACDGFK